MSSTLDTLRQFVDRKAYGWLEEIDPEMVAFIERAMDAGESPEDIRATVSKTCSAYGGEYADLCRSAARYIKSAQGR